MLIILIYMLTGMTDFFLFLTLMYIPIVGSRSYKITVRVILIFVYVIRSKSAVFPALIMYGVTMFV